MLYLVDKERHPGFYTYNLTILDVSDPPNPALFSTRSDLGGALRDVDVLDDIAFVSASTEIHILDVSDPANTILLKSQELYGAANAILEDSLAFIFKYDTVDSVVVLSLSDPANPVRIGAHESSDPISTSPNMILSNSLLFTTCEIIDVSDPSAPVSISSYTLSCSGTGLGLWGNSLLRTTSDRIDVYDITDIEAPFYVDSYYFPGRIHDVQIRGDIAYVGALFQGLVVLDISDIQHPVVIGGIENTYDYEYIDVQGEILCDGIHVVDVSDPTNPVVIANLGNSWVLDVDLKDNLAFVVSYDEELIVFDLSDPSDPVLLSTYPAGFLHHAKVALKDTLAFLSVYGVGAAVHIISYADPSAPELVGTYGTGYSMVVAVDEDIMYTRLSSDLHVVDVSDPSNPTLLGTYDEFTFWTPWAMVPQGDYLYTTDAYGNSVVFDVSDPGNPLFVENFRTPSEHAENLVVVDDTVFVADKYGLMILHTPYNGGARHVSFDIKPGSCPNPLNWRINPNGKSVLPAAILGGENLDVHDIDITSVRLLDDLEPVRYDYEDVATPVDSAGEECDCTVAGPDGHVDLTLKFDRRAVLEKLHAMPESDQYTVSVSAALLDSGEPVEGYDCVYPVGREDSGSDITIPEADGHSESFEVRGNRPNPFNPATEINFRLPEPSHVTLDVFSITGRRVVTLADDYFAKGDHSVTWDGRATSGQRVADGVYFYRIRAGKTTVTKRMLLLH